MKPKIVISSRDAQKLDRLLASVPDREFPGRDDLEAELARATIVDPAQLPPDVVTMNSTVRFRIASSTKAFVLKLVYPDDADANGNTISILAPVGSALLGLSPGDLIEWPKPGGGVLRVVVEEVVDQLDEQPARAEQLRRAALLLPAFQWPPSDAEGCATANETGAAARC
jgi:regulator of nucleoside diphosphate kinase